MEYEVIDLSDSDDLIHQPGNFIEQTRKESADFDDVIDEDVWQTTQALLSTVCASLDEHEDEYVDNELSVHLEECMETTSAGPKIVVMNEGTLGSDEEKEEEERDEPKVEPPDVVEGSQSPPKTRASIARAARAAELPNVDQLVESELQQLTISRDTRKKRRQARSQYRDLNSFSLLLRNSAAARISVDLPNEKQVQTARDPALLETSLVHCCSAIVQISSRLPEAEDQLNAYRFASSLFLNTQLLEINEQLNWRVNALGGGLKRAHMELITFKTALHRTVGDLREEVEILRKNTIGTLRHIVQGDLQRREKMQEQWQEVQTYIRRKNKRIYKLTDQMKGANIDVGILLASHKDKIEQACIAERNLFRMTGKVEDLELELQKKTKMLDERRCPRCDSSAEETQKEQREKEARLKQREERRRQLEAVEQRKYACAERYEKALQSHVDSHIQSLKTSNNLPWHNELPKESVGPSGLPLFVPPGTRSAQPNQRPTAELVSASAIDENRLRLEQAERHAHRQEILNAALTRELTNCRTEMNRLRMENEKLKGHVSRLNVACERLRTTPRVPLPKSRVGRSPGEVDTPPDSNSEKSKDEHPQEEKEEGGRKNLLPRPPVPPNLHKSPLVGVDSPLSPPLRPPISETQREIRQIDEKLEQLNQRQSFHEQQRRDLSPPPPVFVPILTPSTAPVKRFFPPTVRSYSPERAAKRPALGPPPLQAPLLPPARRPPAFHEPPAHHFHPRPERERTFFEDFSKPSFHPPHVEQRAYSPPPPHFEPVRLEPSWAQREHRSELMGPSNGWRQPPAHAPHFHPPPACSVIRNGPPGDMRPLPNGPPSFRPPLTHYAFDQPPQDFYPRAPPQMRPQELPWHNGGPPLDRRSTSWIQPPRH